MDIAQADYLLSELMLDPERFYRSGRSYELLALCFEGYPLDRVAAVLRTADVFAQRVGMFVVSELGEAGCPLLDEVVELAHAADAHVRYLVVEVVAVCATRERASLFGTVIAALEDIDARVWSRAMEMLLVAEDEQIAAVAQSRIPGLREAHRDGLVLLARSTSEESLRYALRSGDPLMIRYAAVAARRRHVRWVLDEISKSADVSDEVRNFVSHR